MPILEPYLQLGDVELANSLRTLTYLRRGLGGPNFSVGVRSPLAAEGGGYSDTYSDTYSSDPYWPGNLACYCELLEDGAYVSPDADPAPWYDASRPESADFLGIIPDVVLPTVLSRSARGRGDGGGAVLGLQGYGPRLVQVTGAMYASSLAGMAWGERWLTQVLAGDPENCPDEELLLLPLCPPADAEEPEAYWRRVAPVALIDGPLFGTQSSVPSCHMQSVAFQLAGGRPHLFGLAEALVTNQYLRTDPTACAVISTPVLGRAASRITLRAGTTGGAVTGVEITATPTEAGVCPSADDPTVAYTVALLPRGRELVIDAARREVTLTELATGESTQGLAALDFDGLFDWMDTAAGSELCICVDATAGSTNAGTTVTIEQIALEL